MQQLILIGALLAVLALLAQVRRRRIAPPAPLAERVRTRVTRTDGGVQVELRGARGVALSFHRARWEPPVEVLEASGPLTLVGARDVRRYVLAGAPSGAVELRGLWEQLTFREVTFAIDLAAAVPADLDDRRDAGRRRPAARLGGDGRRRGAAAADGNVTG